MGDLLLKVTATKAFMLMMLVYFASIMALIFSIVLLDTAYNERHKGEIVSQNVQYRDEIPLKGVQ